MELPILGIGITYSAEIEPVLESNPDLVNFLEIEPQTHWYHTKVKSDHYRINEEAVQRIGSYKCTKILHGVGSPVGGSTPPDHKQIPLLIRMISELAVPWMSEHLSFNRVKHQSADFKTGFFLPPLQTLAGVATAVRSIKTITNLLPIPFAVENGVNYLRRRGFEISDGQFLRKVTEAAECGIVLDLHNAWTNELNGRQTVSEFLNDIPLERVWEVHLAGGSENEGYWLDSHSDVIPKQLLDTARRVIPSLTNLRGIVFEIEPSYLSVADPDYVSSQLKELHKLWSASSVVESYMSNNPIPIHPSIQSKKFSRSPSPIEWEEVLGKLAIGQDIQGKLATELSCDPGINIIRKCISSVRSSMVVKTLKLTSRLLMLTLGVEQFKILLASYWNESTPQLFATTEALGFAKFLERNLTVTYLDEILMLEVAILTSLTYDTKQEIQFQNDPRPVIDALQERRLPDTPCKGYFEVEVTPNNVQYREVV